MTITIVISQFASVTKSNLYSLKESNADYTNWFVDLHITPYFTPYIGRNWAYWNDVLGSG